MGRVTPPREHVSAGQHLLGQPVLRLILGGRTNLYCVSQEVAETGGNRAVHALRISLRHAGSISFDILVVVLAPDGDTDRIHDRSVCQCGPTHMGWDGPCLGLPREAAPEGEHKPQIPRGIDAAEYTAGLALGGRCPFARSRYSSPIVTHGGV